MNIAHKPPYTANILLLSDNADMRDMWHIVLHHQYPELRIHHAYCNDTGEAFARELAPDVIVVESSWPSFSGLISLQNLHTELDEDTLLLGISFDQPHYEEDVAFRSICTHIFEHPVQISWLHRYIRTYLDRAEYTNSHLQMS